jgi:hypothetical protein
VKAPPPLKKPIKVEELLRRRLKEVGRTTAELAEAAQVPLEYLEDILAGRRRPPLPSRTDLYDRMTAYLRLSHKDLVLCATAQRAEIAPARASAPKPAVRKLLLALCDPATGRELERRRANNGNAELTDLFQRLLDVTQGIVLRALNDQISLRVAAQRTGMSLPDARLEVLEFLDLTPDLLTPEDVARFVEPRIANWDVELETGVLRVVLRVQEPRESGRRRPSVRMGF